MQEEYTEHEKKRLAFECGKTDSDKLRRFVAGSAMVTLSQIIGGVFGFIWMVFMTRFLSESHFGVLGPFMYALWIMASVVSLGIPHAVGAYMSHNMDEHPELAYRFGWEGMRALSFLGSGSSLFVALFAVFLYYWGVFPDSDVVPRWVWLGWFWALAFTSLNRQLYFGISGIFMGVQRMDFFGYCQMISPIAHCIGSVGLALLAQRVYGSDHPAQIVFAAFGIGFGAISAFLLGVFLLNRIGFHKARDYFRSRGKGQMLGIIIRFGWLTATANAGFLVIKDISSLLVMMLANRGIFAEGYQAGMGVTQEMLADSLRYSGYFASAIMYSQIPIMLVGLINALIPAMSQAHSAGNNRLMQKYYDLALKYMIVAMIGIIATFGIGAGAVCEIASDYPAEQMHHITFFLVAGGSIGAMLLLHMFLFLGLKRPGLSAALVIGVLVVEIPAIVILTLMTRNVLFAALGFAVTVFIGFGVSVFMVRRLGFRFSSRLLAVPGAAGLISWFVMSRIWSPYSKSAVVGMALGGGLYALLILAYAALTGQKLSIRGIIDDATTI